MSGPGTGSVSPSTARRVWEVLEPLHALIYFAPEARDAFTDLGLKGFWMGYFASRAAPMGAVDAPVVTATFFNFPHRMVARALPDAWAYASPDAVLRSRYAAADAMWRRVFGDADVEELVDLARRAATAACDELAGRALFAAHAALEWPDAPHVALWHAATLLREHRGDAHVAALVAEGVSGAASHVLAVAAGATTRERLQPSRGWDDDEWDAAAATVAGRERELRAAVEARTDAAALPPLLTLGAAGLDRLIELATPLTARVIGTEVPVPNPIGVR